MSYDKTIWENGDVITSEKLNKIEQGIEDGNAQLPNTGNSDNGKVLGVANGMWGKTSLPVSSKGILYVDYTLTSKNGSQTEFNAQSENVYWGDVIEAYEAGRPVYARVTLSDGTYLIPLSHFHSDMGAFEFTTIVKGNPPKMLELMHDVMVTRNYFKIISL